MSARQDLESFIKNLSLSSADRRVIMLYCDAAAEERLDRALNDINSFQPVGSSFKDNTLRLAPSTESA